MKPSKRPREFLCVFAVRLVWLVIACVLLCSGSLLSLLPAQAQMAGWTPEVNISNTPGESAFPAIAADRQGNVHVVWREEPGGLYYARWTKGLWSAPRAIFPDLLGHIPDIAAGADGTLHVVWVSGHIYYSNSSDGDFWSSPTIVSGLGFPYFSAIAVDSAGAVHVAWMESASPDGSLPAEVYYSQSSDLGRSWSPAVNVSRSPESSTRPAVAVDDSGAIHVAWSEDEDPAGANDLGDDVYYSRSDDRGASWSPPTRLSSGSGDAGIPRLGVDSGNTVHLVFVDHGSGSPGQVFHRCWDGGDWTPPQQAMVLPGRASGSFAWPHFTIDNQDRLHVVAMVQYRRNYQIYYAQSTAGGDNWSVTEGIPDTPWESNRPQIAVDSGGRLHVVWYDYAAGNADIYYSSAEIASLSVTPQPTPWPTSTTVAATPTTTVTPPPAMEHTATPEPAYVVVQADRVNVRAGPGADYAIVGQVTEDTRLQIVTRNPEEDWWQVCCYQDQQVWIAAHLVETHGPLPGTPPPPPTPAPEMEQTSTPGTREATAAIPMSLPAPSAAGWTVPTDISNTPRYSMLAAISADQMGQIHVVWTDILKDDEGDDVAGVVLYAYWNGAEWSEPADVLLSPYGFPWNTIPVVAVDNVGYVHVVWTASYELHSRALHGAAVSASAWEDPKIISGFGFTYFSDLTIDRDGLIHAVWEEEAGGAFQIYYSHSSDGGGSWSEPVGVVYNPQNSRRPDVVVDQGGVIHVAWADEADDGGCALGDEVYYSYSTDEGRSWSEPLNLSNTQGPSGIPRLAVDKEGILYVVYVDTDDILAADVWADVGKLYLKKMEDGLWSPAVEVPEGGLGPASWPDVAVDSDNNVHVVWMEKPLEGDSFSSEPTQDPDYPGTEIYYTYWDNQHWAAPVNVSNTPGGSARPRIAVSEGNKLHVVWWDSTPGNWDIYYTARRSQSPAVAPRPFQPTPTATATPAPVATLSSTEGPAPAATPVPATTRQNLDMTTPTPTSTPTIPVIAAGSRKMADPTRAMVTPLLMGAIPVLLLVTAVLLFKTFWKGRNGWNR